MTTLRIQAPAGSANLGPGFDTLAMALDIMDTIHVELGDEPGDVRLQVVDREAPALHETDNLICRAYRAWFEEIARPPLAASFRLESRIPMGKGLGSSAASIVGGLAAAAFACQEKEATETILRLAAGIEGHADNVAAAAMGGVTVAFRDGENVRALHVANHLSLGVSLFVPDKPLMTSEARAALPEMVPLSDAVYNLGRLAYLTTALIWGRWESIGPAMEDRLHQPYRARLMPAMRHVIGAALEAGAYGAALSGGGPSIVALGPPESANQTAAAMETMALAKGWQGRGLVTRISQWGVRVEEVKASTDHD